MNTRRPQLRSIAGALDAMDHADPRAPCRPTPRLDLPLDVQATAFQWQVWQALAAIPYGETRTYGEVAARSGGRARSAPSRVPAPPIPWRWRSPVIAWCRRQAATAAIAGASSARRRCCRERAGGAGKAGGAGGAGKAGGAGRVGRGRKGRRGRRDGNGPDAARGRGDRRRASDRRPTRRDRLG